MTISKELLDELLSGVVDLSRFSAAPGPHLCSLLFKSQWAFPA